MHFLKPISIILLFNLISHQSFCQNDSLIYVENDSLYFNRYKYYDLHTKFYISVSPLAFIDFNDGGSIRFSGDVRIFKQVALSTEFGFYTSYTNHNYDKSSPRGFLIKPCIKVIPKNFGRYNNAYIALEYQYKRQTYRLNDSIKIDPATIYHKDYGMSRYINCINLKYGELYYLSRTILLEYFIGCGVRFSNTATDLSQQEYDSILRGESHNNGSYNQQAIRVIGRHVMPNLTLGGKIGIRL